MCDFRRAGIVVVLLAGTTAAGADVLHDPMRPFAPRTPGEVTRKTESGYALSAILYSADRRVAVVNGEAVSEGDRVGAARIRRIARGEVELELDGRILRLALNKP